MCNVCGSDSEYFQTKSTNREHFIRGEMGFPQTKNREMHSLDICIYVDSYNLSNYYDFYLEKKS